MTQEEGGRESTLNPHRYQLGLKLNENSTDTSFNTHTQTHTQCMHPRVEDTVQNTNITLRIISATENITNIINKQ